MTLKAAAQEPMCQPSASSAVYPKTLPATSSATIIASVRPTTHRVRRSLSEKSAVNRCSSVLRRYLLVELTVVAGFLK